MNYVKKLNLHWFCTQNHILEPFSVRRACTKSYVTSEPYPRASQIWCQNVRETWKKKVIKCRGESFARCRVIARNVEGGGGLLGPPPVFLGLKAASRHGMCARPTSSLQRGHFRRLWRTFHVGLKSIRPSGFILKPVAPMKKRKNAKSRNRYH